MASGGLLTPKEASEYLRLCEKTLYNLTKRGELVSVKIGRSVRYRPSDLEAFIDRLVTAGGQAPISE